MLLNKLAVVPNSFFGVMLLCYTNIQSFIDQGPEIVSLPLSVIMK
jgi:hypothetical protein